MSNRIRPVDDRGHHGGGDFGVNLDEPQPHEEAKEGSTPYWRSTLVMSWKKKAAGERGGGDDVLQPGE